MSSVSISKVAPLAGYVLVEPAEAQAKTASGIYVATENQEKPQYGKVVAVGADALIDGGIYIDTEQPSRRRHPREDNWEETSEESPRGWASRMTLGRLGNGSDRDHLSAIIQASITRSFGLVSAGSMWNHLD